MSYKGRHRKHPELRSYLALPYYMSKKNHLVNAFNFDLVSLG